MEIILLNGIIKYLLIKVDEIEGNEELKKRIKKISNKFFNQIKKA